MFHNEDMSRTRPGNVLCPHECFKSSPFVHPQTVCPFPLIKWKQIIEWAIVRFYTDHRVTGLV